MIPTVVETYSCYYMSSENEGVDGVTGTYVMGPFTVQQFRFVHSTFWGGSCVRWDEHNELDLDDIDASIRVSRIFLTISTYGGLAF